jgi:hypothetical protein
MLHDPQDQAAVAIFPLAVSAPTAIQMRSGSNRCHSRERQPSACCPQPIGLTVHIPPRRALVTQSAVMHGCVGVARPQVRLESSKVRFALGERRRGRNELEVVGRVAGEPAVVHGGQCVGLWVSSTRRYAEPRMLCPNNDAQSDLRALGRKARYGRSETILPHPAPGE